MKNIRFVTSCYGDDYIGLLLTNIFSISQSNPQADISVLWEQLDEKKISLLKQAFPKVDFVEADFDIKGSFIERISNKTKLWEMAVKQYPEEYLCLLDCDTLVRKDISDFYNQEFDIIFTDKEGVFPLNTGVMLVKNSASVINFFTQWREQTIAVIQDKIAFKKANSLDYPYGGADQMAFYTLIGYKKGKKEHIFSNNDQKIVLQAISCELLNETRSTQVTEQTHVIHYKGGWRPILLEGGGFTKNRPKQTSWGMYLLFLKTYLQAISQLNKIDKEIVYQDFNIKIPFYLNKDKLEENKWLYWLFAFKEATLLYPRKIKRLLIKK